MLRPSRRSRDHPVPRRGLTRRPDAPRLVRAADFGHAGGMETVPDVDVQPRPIVRQGVTRFASEVAGRLSTSGRPRHPQRRTRIVATIGPASDAPDTMRALAAAGMDVARVTLAHGSIDEAIARVRALRAAAPEVGILADLPGPKIRTAPFAEGGVVLTAGAELELVPGSTAQGSTAERIAVAIDEVVHALEEGDPIALGDGGVSLVVLGKVPGGVKARVRSGGRLQGRPDPVDRPGHLPVPHQAVLRRNHRDDGAGVVPPDTAVPVEDLAVRSPDGHQGVGGHLVGVAQGFHNGAASGRG